MRLFVLFVAAALLKQCTGESGKKTTGTIKVEYGFYCPTRTNWEYKISISGAENSPPVIRGKATNHFESISMDNVLTSSDPQIQYWVEQTCRDGKWAKLFPVGLVLEENKITYEFIAYDLSDLKTYSAVAFEKLFFHYLKKECVTGDCSAIRDRVSVSCSNNRGVGKEICNNNFEKALKSVMADRPPSSSPPIGSDTTTRKSNTTTFIIIGSVVGVVLLIAVVVTYFLCKKKKKASKQTGSGMSGTGTGSNTMTKSGTTKQGTTTGTFQKTRTAGTGNTGNTTTGGQRY